MNATLQCDYFDAGACRSCSLIGTPYEAQLAGKVTRAKSLFATWPDAEWLPPMASRPEGFRNKAKMVVGGTVDHPTLGILDASGKGVDITGCKVLSLGLRAAFAPIAAFITQARILPYDIPARRGELKYVLLTESPDGELMVRFVLRSTEALERIRKYLPSLVAALPQIAVASVNLLPEHKAVLEGETEIPLVGETLTMRLGSVVLHLRPGSFFQTNTDVAAGLYAQARDWIDEVGARSVLDLYCGVGGFSLGLFAPGRRVHGVEVSTPAVASAQRSAAEAGLDGVTFAVGDATAITTVDKPDAIIVNPPRRGLGEALCTTLDASGVLMLIYSSCNATTLARDVAAMPSYAPVRFRLFDMFPQTEHAEVMVLLTRIGR